MLTPTEIRPGTLINERYQVLQLLGQGGFGRTYQVADQQSSGQLLVIKEFVAKNQDTAVVQEAKEHFQREAKILQQLQHPQIPKFVEFFAEKNYLFIVQEYINGQTYRSLLQERLQNGKKFTEAEIIPWLKAMLEVLDYLHTQRKVIHRDISPDNIMLPQGEPALPVLIDFGAATWLEDQGFEANAASENKPVTRIGKENYAPPEQMEGGQCSPSNDLYSLGVTAVVLLTGKEPNQLRDPHTLDWCWQDFVTVKPDLVQILNQMMAYKPKDRYPSAQAVLAELRSLDFIGAPSPFVEPSAEVVLADLRSLNQISPTRISAAAQKPAAKSRLLKPAKILVPLLSSLGVLSTGGAIAWTQAPHIALLCKTLDNCVQDQQAQTTYQQATAQAKAAELLAENALELPELQSARDRMAQAIAQLQTIDQTVKVFDQVESTLYDYQNRLKSLEQKLQQETQAQEKLQQATAAAYSAQQTTTTATTIPAKATAKAQWQQASNLLTTISPHTLASNEAQRQWQAYQEQINQLNLEIEQLQIAEQQPQQPPAQTARMPEKSPPLVRPQAPTTSWQPPAPQSAAPPPQPSQRQAPLWGGPEDPPTASSEAPLW